MPNKRKLNARPKLNIKNPKEYVIKKENTQLKEPINEVADILTLCGNNSADMSQGKGPAPMLYAKIFTAIVNIGTNEYDEEMTFCSFK